MIRHLLGRVLIELGNTNVDDEAWNRIPEIAIRATFFNESPTPFNV
jgi:hypothetical protein